jgi:hypothetical protein
MASIVFNPLNIKFFRDWQELEFEYQTSHMICLNTDIRTKRKVFELGVRVGMNPTAMYMMTPIEINIEDIDARSAHLKKKI